MYLGHSVTSHPPSTHGQSLDLIFRMVLSKDGRPVEPLPLIYKVPRNSKNHQKPPQCRTPVHGGRNHRYSNREEGEEPGDTEPDHREEVDGKAPLTEVPRSHLQWLMCDALVDDNRYWNHV